MVPDTGLAFFLGPLVPLNAEIPSGDRPSDGCSLIPPNPHSEIMAKSWTFKNQTLKDDLSSEAWISSLVGEGLLLPEAP